MQAILEQEDFAVTVGNGRGGGYDMPLAGYEYKGPVADQRYTKQCWVAATPGQHFCIHYAYNGPVRRLASSKGRAGLFCKLYMDEAIVEHAFLPLNNIRDCTSSNREWEITGEYYREATHEQGEPPKERPFGFATSALLGANSSVSGLRGTIRVVLYWARPDSAQPNPYPTPTKTLADELDQYLSLPVTSNRHMSCVSLGAPRLTEVKENNMQVRAVDNKRYTFIFHYAHPDWLRAQGIIPQVLVSRRKRSRRTVHKPY